MNSIFFKIINGRVLKIDSCQTTTELYEQCKDYAVKQGITLELLALVPVCDDQECLDYFLSMEDRQLNEISKRKVVLKTVFQELPKPFTQRVLNYEVIKVIGKGGFSKVIQVRHRITGKLHAMKVMNKKKISEKGKFHQKHYLNIVLDFCPGGELFYHLSQRRKFSESEARFIICELILALEYLHYNDIIYRDLKVRAQRLTLQPENILVDIDGHIRLTDFGLSRENFKINDRSDSFCGSPEYMSPDMLQRGKHSRMVDFYSLGALTYELLVGLPPNYSEDKNKMYNDIVNKQPEYPGFLSQSAVNLLKGLLEKNPQKRLGFKNQFKEVKSNDFFSGVDWQKVLNKDSSIGQSPLKPQLTTCYFDQNFVYQLNNQQLAKIYEYITEQDYEQVYGLSDVKKRGRARAQALVSDDSFTSSFEAQNELSQIDGSSSFTKVKGGASRNLQFSKNQKFMDHYQRNFKPHKIVAASSCQIKKASDIFQYENPQSPQQKQEEVKFQAKKPNKKIWSSKNSWFDNLDDPTQSVFQINQKFKNGSGQIPIIGLNQAFEESMELQTITDVDESPKSPIQRRYQNIIDNINEIDDFTIQSSTPIHMKKCKSQTPERLREDVIKIQAQFKNFDINKLQQQKQKNQIPMNAIQSILSLQSPLSFENNNKNKFKLNNKNATNNTTQTSQSNKQIDKQIQNINMNFVKYNEKLQNIISERKRNKDLNSQGTNEPRKVKVVKNNNYKQQCYDIRSRQNNLIQASSQNSMNNSQKKPSIIKRNLSNRNLFKTQNVGSSEKESAKSPANGLSTGQDRNQTESQDLETFIPNSSLNENSESNYQFEMSPLKKIVKKQQSQEQSRDQQEEIKKSHHHHSKSNKRIKKNSLYEQDTLKKEEGKQAKINVKVQEVKQVLQKKINAKPSAKARVSAKLHAPPQRLQSGFLNKKASHKLIPTTDSLSSTKYNPSNTKLNTESRENMVISPVLMSRKATSKLEQYVTPSFNKSAVSKASSKNQSKL